MTNFDEDRLRELGEAIVGRAELLGEDGSEGLTEAQEDFLEAKATKIIRDTAGVTVYWGLLVKGRWTLREFHEVVRRNGMRPEDIAALEDPS